MSICVINDLPPSTSESENAFADLMIIIAIKCVGLLHRADHY